MREMSQNGRPRSFAPHLIQSRWVCTYRRDLLQPLREQARSHRMQDTTNILRRTFAAMTLSGALALTAGCHSTPAGPDPAQANLAPANGQTQVLGQNVSYSPQQQGEY